jgi:hydroxyacylglutathione hydrolase
MVEIVPIPALDDNYVWLIRNDRAAAAVDPGEAAPVLHYLKRHSLELTAILITHHHHDHTGGNAELLACFHVPVYGPRGELVATVNRPLGEGCKAVIAEPAVQLEVLDTPGHTPGHLSYYGLNSLFCGDTLFACGCGRLLGGTAAQMTASLQRLAGLPDTTRIFCAHEYTLANIRFALSVEPDNPALQQREATERDKRALGLPTLPSTIGLEKQTNPFLRLGEPAVIQAASRFSGQSLSDPVSVFAALREWKNRH